MTTLDQALRQMPTLTDGADHTRLWNRLRDLETKVNERSKEHSITAAALLMRAIDLSKHADPAGTLKLIAAANADNLGHPKLTALRATCYDRIGDHAAAKADTETVVNDENAPPESVLVAANLLVRYNEQEKALQAALKAYEQMGRPLHHTATVLYITQRCAAFAESDKLTAQITRAYADGSLTQVAETPRTNLLWSADEAMNIAVTKLWANKALTRDAKIFNGIRRPLGNRRLKIGYLSSDFREHPTLRLMMGVLRNHDQQAVDVVLICSGWDDKSAIRKEAEQFCSKVLTVTHLNDADAAQAIRAEEIDVLVELNGPTRANRMSILPHRVAPVQVDYLGWAGSVGGVGVDYIVGDYWTVPPGAERLYPERVMRMDPTYQINDHASFKPVVAPSRADLGLPEEGLVFGVFNAINKIQGDVWACWMSILKNVPNSVLWILDPGDAARRRLGRYAKASGIDVKRIIGASAMRQEHHLNRIAAADLMLDPWPYGGHTSTSDALYAGVPVVTINGKNFPGRVSAGLLRAAGLPELVAANPKDYVAKVLTLANNPQVLQRYKDALKLVCQTTCFDAVSRTRQMEALFRHAYLTWAKNEPKTHLNVPNAKPPQTPLVSALPVTVLNADQGYGSNPPWVSRGAPAPNAEPPANRAVSPAQKRRVALICGPWSGGTSATAQVIEALGAQLVGDMFQTVDERTETYEMAAFRLLLLRLADEATISRKVDRAQAIAAFSEFADTHLARVTGPVLLKHPLSALFIAELEEVFELQIVTVIRSFDDIERTRIRRGWRPHFGRAGAEKIYLLLSDALSTCKSPTYWFKYQDLVENPYKQVVDIAGFLGYGTDTKSLEQAISRVRKR